MADVGDFAFDACDCPPPVVATPPVLVDPQSSGNLSGPGRFGIDVDAVLDVPLRWNLASGTRNLGNNLARRLGTVLGSMPDDPNYGFDLRDMLNGGFTPTQLGQLRASVVAECLKDPRVQDCQAAFSWNSPQAAFTATLTITTADGVFTFVLGVSDVSVALLDSQVNQ
jgi:hypothetical protein